jgi:hypothetical protein
MLPALILLFTADIVSYGADRKIPEEEQGVFGGTIITREGKIIHVVEFLSPLKDNYIKGEYLGRVLRIRPSELKEVFLLEEGCGYGYYFHGPYWKGRMRITYRSGEELEISSADFCSYNLQDREFQFKVWNHSLGKHETRWIMTTRIERITITAAE